MKQRYRLFRRAGGIFYTFDNDTAKQHSLKTNDKEEALRLLHAKNEAERQPQISRQIARAYLSVSDPVFVQRTWQDVMDEMAKEKTGETQKRWIRAMHEEPFDRVRHHRLQETTKRVILDAIGEGTVSTNIFMRRLHNFALGMNYIFEPIVPPRKWPKIRFKAKRGITAEEHRKIICGEQNPEWRAYYALLWELGGSQTDIALLCAENVNWKNRTVAYRRKKNNRPALAPFGATAAEILNALPKTGSLFPMISKWPETDRAIAFARRCRRIGISGVSLHSYRYAWAERAMAANYPERLAMKVLGHKSEAVHRAYARNATVELVPLEEFETRQLSGKIIRLHTKPKRERAFAKKSNCG